MRVPVPVTATSAPAAVLPKKPFFSRRITLSVFFFAGYALASALDLPGALFGTLAFLLSIVFIIVYDRRMAKKEKAVYTITGYASDALLHPRKRG